MATQTLAPPTRSTPAAPARRPRKKFPLGRVAATTVVAFFAIIWLIPDRRIESKINHTEQ